MDGLAIQSNAASVGNVHSVGKLIIGLYEQIWKIKVKWYPWQSLNYKLSQESLNIKQNSITKNV